MQALKSKVAKMERARHGESEADRRHRWSLNNRLCACLATSRPWTHECRTQRENRILYDTPGVTACPDRSPSSLLSRE
jgi:hypothetical protein